MAKEYRLIIEEDPNEIEIIVRSADAKMADQLAFDILTAIISVQIRKAARLRGGT